MKRFDLLLIALATVAGVVAVTSPVSGQADEQAAPTFSVTSAVSDTSTKSHFVAGAWQLDNRLSDAQLITDATTGYGKNKVDLTLGFARINGAVTIDDEHPKNSRIDFTIYPANSILPSIDENGVFLSDWSRSRAPHHRLVCFHSRHIVRTPDGRLQASGELALTSVDTNFEAESTSNEGLAEVQADPPPMVHRTTREVTFSFDLPVADERELKSGNIRASGSTTVSREYFPQIVTTAISTYWPPLIQEENCDVTLTKEIYGQSHCTGTFLEPHGFPQEFQSSNGKDLHGSQNFNAILGDNLTIIVHMRLVPRSSGE